MNDESNLLDENVGEYKRIIPKADKSKAQNRGRGKGNVTAYNAEWRDKEIARAGADGESLSLENRKLEPGIIELVLECGRQGYRWPEVAERVTAEGFRRPSGVVYTSATVRSIWERYSSSDDRRLWDTNRKTSARYAPLIEEVLRWRNYEDAAKSLNELEVNVPNTPPGTEWTAKMVVQRWHAYATEEQKNEIGGIKTKALSMLMELCQTGMDSSEVAQRLNANGLLPPRNRYWTTTSVTLHWKNHATREQREQRDALMAARNQSSKNIARKELLASPCWPLIKELAEDGRRWSDIAYALTAAGYYLDEDAKIEWDAVTLGSRWSYVAPPDSIITRKVARKLGGKPKLVITAEELEQFERESAVWEEQSDGILERIEGEDSTLRTIVEGCALGIDFAVIVEKTGMNYTDVTALWHTESTPEQKEQRIAQQRELRRRQGIFESLVKVKEFEARCELLRLRRGGKNDTYPRAVDAVIALKKMGLTTVAIADRLNSLQFRTMRGLKWKASTVEQAWKRHATDEDRAEARRVVLERRAARKREREEGIKRNLAEWEFRQVER